MLKLKDDVNSRLVVKQAKAFLVLMLVLFFLLNIAFAWLVFSGKWPCTQVLSTLLNLNLLLLTVFVFGELLLLGGLFWWYWIRFEK